MLNLDGLSPPPSDDELEQMWIAEQEYLDDLAWADYIESLERESQPPQDDRNDEGRRAA